MMTDKKTLLLNAKQIDQRLDRIAYQIFEDNYTEKEIVIAGIFENGYLLAEKIGLIVGSISGITITLGKITLQKHSRTNTDVQLNLEEAQIRNKSVIVVDDVLNSGRTLIYALKPFLSAEVQKLRTAVLLDRSHKKFPVSPDYVGLSISTALDEHISVEFTGSEANAYLF